MPDIFRANVNAANEPLSVQINARIERPKLRLDRSGVVRHPAPFGLQKSTAHAMLSSARA